MSAAAVLPLSILGVGCTAIDLSHDLNDKTVCWPGDVAFSLCLHAGADAEGHHYAGGSFACSEHSGTHIDAPFHFCASGATVEQLPIDDLIAPCSVIDVTQQCAVDAGRAISAADILGDEAVHGVLPRGSIVLFRTGWARLHWAGGATEYLGYRATDAVGGFTLCFPGLGLDACDLLIERGVRGVGLDTASLDAGACTSFDAHRRLLGAGVFGIENISASIHTLPPRGATLIALPLRIAGGSGA